MKRRRRASFVVLAGAFAWASGVALPAAARAWQPGPAAPQGSRTAPTTLVDRVDAFVGPLVGRRDFAGSIVIGDTSGVLMERAYGYANLELGTRNHTDTRFGIGSVSKQMTATAILILAQRGVLSLDDPVSRHVDGVPEGDRITIHHLLAHRSGLRRDIAPYPDTQVPRDPEQVLAMISETPLAFEPGEQFAYSNSGYFVLARIVEVASGRPFCEFMRDEVFRPLHMYDTGCIDGGHATPDLATGYDPGTGPRGLTPTVQQDYSNLLGAGSFYSTSGDLYRWGRGLLSGALLDEERETLRKTDHGSGRGYGVGLYSRNDRSVIGHDGVTNGYTAFVEVYPDEGMVVAYAGNIRSGALGVVEAGVTALAFDREPSPFEPPAYAGPGSSPDVDGRAGVYELFPGFDLTVTRRGGDLYLAGTGGYPTALTPLASGQFFYRSMYASIRFETLEDGQDGLVWVGRDGTEYPAPRRDAADPEDPPAPPAGETGIFVTADSSRWVLHRWSFDFGDGPSERTSLFDMRTGRVRALRDAGRDAFEVGPRFWPADGDSVAPVRLVRRADGRRELRLPPAYGGTATERPAFRERDLSFVSDGATLRGTLSVPIDAPEPWPAVVLVHGSGLADRDAFGLGPAAAFLASHGVAVLRYDKRGAGESDGPARPGLEPLARDAIAAVDALRAVPGVDPGKVGLWGLSQGGWVSVIAAARSDAIGFLITVSGGGVPVREEEVYNVVAELEARGFANGDLEQARSYMEAYIRAARTGTKEDWATYRQALDGAAATEWYRTTARPWTWNTREGAHGAWSREIGFDPGPDLARIDVPVLAIVGLADRSHPPEANVRGLAEGLAAGADPPFESVALPGTNHDMLVAKTGSSREYAGLDRFDIRYFEAMARWIGALGRPGEASYGGGGAAVPPPAPAEVAQ